jgi:hypothetical protein
MQAGTLAALTRLTHLKLTIHKDDLMGNMEEALAALTGLHSLHVTPPLQVVCCVTTSSGPAGQGLRTPLLHHDRHLPAAHGCRCLA